LGPVISAKIAETGASRHFHPKDPEFLPSSSSSSSLLLFFFFFVHSAQFQFSTAVQLRSLLLLLLLLSRGSSASARSASSVSALLRSATFLFPSSALFSSVRFSQVDSNSSLAAPSAISAERKKERKKEQSANLRVL
jgi:hypothetical protein